MSLVLSLSAGMLWGVTTKEKRKNLRARLMKTFEALPVRAFDVDEAKDPETFLPMLFGPGTTVRPFIRCADLGAWVGGWTVITTLPNGRGTHAFVLREYNDRCGIETEWENLSRGSRINVLAASIQHPTWHAGDLAGLVSVLGKKIAKMEADWFDFDSFGALNDEPEAWLLRHALSVLSAEEQDVTQFLMALSHDSDTATLLLGKVSNILANWQHTREGETAVVEAVQRFNGVTLHGAQVERLGLAGALMTYPRDTWSQEADRLVVVAYGRMSLDERYHPKPDPPKPPNPPKSGSRRNYFPLAV